MSKRDARTRLSASKNAASSIHIKEEMRGAGQYQYLTHCVQGWKEGGARKRKRFKDRKEAERFAALKRVEVENQGRAQTMLLTSLSEDQTREAENAIQQLGEA